MCYFQNKGLGSPDFYFVPDPTDYPLYIHNFTDSFKIIMIIIRREPIQNIHSSVLGRTSPRLSGGITNSRTSEDSIGRLRQPTPKLN